MSQGFVQGSSGQTPRGWDEHPHLQTLRRLLSLQSDCLPRVPHNLPPPLTGAPKCALFCPSFPRVSSRKDISNPAFTRSHFPDMCRASPIDQNKAVHNAGIWVTSLAPLLRHLTQRTSYIPPAASDSSPPAATRSAAHPDPGRRGCALP